MNTQKKILFILPTLNIGGAERIAVNFMRKLDPARFDVTLALFEKTTNLLEEIPASVKIVDLQTICTSRSFWPLLKLLRRLKPDVVYTTHSRTATLLMLVRPFAPGFRHLARMQNTPSLEKKHGVYGTIKRRLYGAGFKRADAVIAQTMEMKKDGEEVFGISPSKTVVLHNPLDIENIKKCTKENVSPFSKGEIAAVAAGGIARQKGFKDIVQALPEILQKCPDFVLHILGTDLGEKTSLIKLAETMDVLEHIKFHGFVSNPYPFYAHCDLFILSSYWEGFPNAMLENYYLNTPIVATTCVPVVGRLIEEGENGYLCDPGDTDCLAEKIIKGLRMKREQIKNHELPDMNLEKLFETNEQK